MTKVLCESCKGMGCMTCAGSGFVKEVSLNDLSTEAGKQSMKVEMAGNAKFTLPKPQSFLEYWASAESALGERKASEVPPKKLEISPYYQLNYSVFDKDKVTAFPKLEDLPSMFVVQRSGKEVLRITQNGDISGNVNEALESLENCTPDFRNTALKSALEILSKLNV